MKKARKIKDKLLLIAKIAAVVIIAGSLLGFPQKIQEKLNKQEEIVDTIEQENLTSAEDLITMIEEVEQETQEITHSIGDKINLSDGVNYYRDAVSAQMDNNRYVVGKNGLRPENYNINRIAIMEKDQKGLPTGKILAINSNPGVSAEELAASLGLSKGQYEVMIHIGSGDEHGNYIEADANRKSTDDLCWLKSDSPGISLVKPASEILKENERGMTR